MECLINKKLLIRRIKNEKKKHNNTLFYKLIIKKKESNSIFFSWKIKSFIKFSIFFIFLLSGLTSFSLLFVIYLTGKIIIRIIQRLLTKPSKFRFLHKSISWFGSYPPFLKFIKTTEKLFDFDGFKGLREHLI